MKVYIVSGLGADAKVLNQLKFNLNLTPVFIHWLIPLQNETLENYVRRMANEIDDQKEFYLLGYSFGGIIVQEINKIKKAKKVMILGSLKSFQEKPWWMKSWLLEKFFSWLPIKIYGVFSTKMEVFISSVLRLKKSSVATYFTFKNPTYLKWAILRIFNWKGTKQDGIIQILAEHDTIFPLKNSHPEHIIKNATHLFPLTKASQVSEIIAQYFV